MFLTTLQTCVDFGGRHKINPPLSQERVPSRVRHELPSEHPSLVHLLRGNVNLKAVYLRETQQSGGLHQHRPQRIHRSGIRERESPFLGPAVELKISPLQDRPTNH